MKRNLLIISIILLAGSGIKAQIINGGFEDWSGNWPTGWEGNGPGHPQIDTSAHSGNYCFSYLNGSNYSSLPIVMLQSSNYFFLPHKSKWVSLWYKVNLKGIIGAIVGFSLRHGGKEIDGPYYVDLPPTDVWTKVYYDLDKIRPDTLEIDSLDIFFLNLPGPHPADNKINLWVDDINIDSLKEGIASEKLVGMDIQVSPNPANLFVTVTCDPRKNQLQSFTIVNVMGNKIYDLIFQPQEKSHGQSKINISFIPNGVYFVQIECTNGFVAKKLIISH